MESKENYKEWLESNPKEWSQATIGKYASVPSIISKDMKELGIIHKSLFDMTKTELECAIFLIFNSPEFIKKDKIGNKMYSNGLKQFRAYIATMFETTNVDESLDAMVAQVNANQELTVTERQAIVSARVGQGKFRNQLLDKYGKCVITGVDNKKLLIASHIKPWSQSDNVERISVDNGLLLTPTYDKLFDYGLITFSDSGKLLVSSFVGKENEQRLHIPKNEKFDLYSTKQLITNMQYHSDVLFVR